MKSKLKFIFLSISIVALIVFFSPETKKNNNVFELGGDWDFYNEMLLYPDDFESDSLPNSSNLNIPKDLMGNLWTFGETNTYGTIRKNFYIYDFDKDEILAIKNGLFRENCKIWIDGELVVDTGDIFTNKHKASLINPTSFGEFQTRDKKIQVIIQFSKFNYYNFSSSGLSISKLDDLMKMQTKNLGLDLFLLGSVLVLCIYHLIFFFRSKTFGNKTGALYFSLLFLMISLRIINVGDYYIAELFPKISFEVLNKLGFWAFYSMLPLLILFNNEIFIDFYDKKYIKINRYVLYILMIVVLVLDFKLYSRLMIPYLIYIIVSVICNIKININSKTKNKKMKTLSYLGFIITVFAIASDFAYITNIYRDRTFAYVGTIVFMILISTLISNRYNEIFTKVQLLACENEEYLNEIKKNNQNLEKKIKNRTQELTATLNMLEVYSNEMKKILDNVGQGFLTIDHTMMVSGEFSKECYKIFGEDIKKKNIAKKLFPYNIDQKLFFETIVGKIYATDSDDENQSDLYLSLLPDEANIRGRLYSVEYKLISLKDTSISIMLILTDITERKELEFEMLEKQNLLNMIVNVVIHYDEFLNLVSSYMTFCKIEIADIMNSGSDFSEKFFRILKEVHTYKGLFHRFAMIETVNLLHSIETEIFEIQDDIESYNPKSVLKIILSYNIVSYVDKDIMILKEKLGEDFLNDKNYIKVHKNIINDLIEEAIDSNCSKKMLDKVKKLKLVSFKKMFEIYPEFITSISSEMGKQILPMKIDGDDFKVESKKYERVIKSLVHVYKNSVSHGIEFEDDRAIKGKKTYGCIKTKIAYGNFITITIEDDGAGVCIEKVKDRLIDRYSYSEDYFVSKTDSEILKMIFKTGYTSLESESIVSGRGVGLSSFMDEVEKIGGSLEIESEIDQYTRIIIKLPIFDLDSSHITEKNDFMSAIAKSSGDLLSPYLPSSLISLNEGVSRIKSSKLDMYRYSSYIEVHGDIRSRLIFTFDEGGLLWIKKTLGISEEEEQIELIEDSIAEISNIIVGNCANLISGFASNIVVGMPLVINDISTMNLSRFDVYQFAVNDKNFNMRVYMVFEKE